ncbi:Nuclear transcription factor Y subunit C-3 [Bienertia sinuspersici]
MDPQWSLPYSDDQQPHSLVNTAPQYNPQQQSEKGSNPLQQHLRSFWDTQCKESQHAIDLRNHSLPLARIKKIMKSDDNVRMISADAPVVLSRACEMFIQDLTLRSWSCTEESKRKTLQKADISAALSTSDLFDFLVDILPREKPFISTLPSIHPTSTIGIVYDHHHEGNYSVGQGAGLNMGLQMHQLVKNDQVNQGSFNSTNSNFVQAVWPNYLYNHPSCPPPDF